MNSLVAFGFLVSLIVVLSQGALLVVEEGTPQANDWRQLRVELPPATFDVNGDITFAKPVWHRQEGPNTLPFAVLGSLDCDETNNVSIAALINGVWGCYWIYDPILPPANGTVRRQLPTDRVEPPATCAEDESALLYVVRDQQWECAAPERSLIQYVRNPPRPKCNNTDLVVYNEAEDWFQCRALAEIQFNSTITKTDLRWQVPSTVRHIGSIASTGTVRSGTYDNFRWSNYAFSASTDLIAYDQTTPPQVITNGGATWLAYTISTSFVGISGSSPYYKTVFSPIYPGTITSYNNNITKTAPGTIIRGDTMTFQPAVVTFLQSGTNQVLPLTNSTFKYNTLSGGPTGGLVVVPVANATLNPLDYPVVQILPSTSNWFVGSTPDFNPNLILTISMWLQYSQPSGF